MRLCDGIWIKLMRAGAMSGCHQRADRSFFLFGYQFPVCARCLGCAVGWCGGFLLYACCGFLPQLAVFGSLIMAADWSVQRFWGVESTNLRRFLTGMLFGAGISNAAGYIIAGVFLSDVSMK